MILCDQLFREAIGADCGGPAELAWIADPASGLGLLNGTAGAIGPAASDLLSFEAAPGRWVTIYRP